jgi:deoxyribodipyrimidine photo-lyase
MTTIVWFRHHDLRVADHPALDRARRRGPVVPVFVWAPEEEGEWPLGGASRWWLHHSLAALDADLRSRGSRLVVCRGPSLAALRRLAAETNASGVCWNRRYEPAAIDRDALVKRELLEEGLAVESFNGSLLREPWEILTGSGSPYRVFTPYWKACLRAGEPPAPRPAPRTLPEPARWPDGEPLESLGLLPPVDWASGMRATWAPGARSAAARLRAFERDGVDAYDDQRNAVDVDGTSMLSPHLQFGEVSPRQVWHAVLKDERRGPDDPYLRQLVWRDFAHALLFHFPETAREPLRDDFRRFPWRRDAAALRRWQRGRTGYPIIDAAMRDLWSRGWMPNRARMIVASFLTKHLLLPWQDGAAWFWDTLVDASLANNTFGWQWTAGCGADAAPYFRIFNPISQAERFDVGGDYIRRWVPEIAALPAPWLYRPWDAPGSVLEAAGIRLGETYPQPIVDHREARGEALAAYQSLR